MSLVDWLYPAMPWSWIVLAVGCHGVISVVGRLERLGRTPRVAAAARRRRLVRLGVSLLVRSLALLALAMLGTALLLGPGRGGVFGGPGDVVALRPLGSAGAFAFGAGLLALAVLHRWMTLAAPRPLQLPAPKVRP